MKLKIFNMSGNNLPAYETKNSAGMDLRADLKEQLRIAPMERVLVGTGLKMQIPEKYEGQVRPRSGLAIKHGITVLNTPGTIDADYRGEVKVILVNLSTVDYYINPGERIAQLVISKIEQPEVINIENEKELSTTERGSGGFGHTGNL